MVSIFSPRFPTQPSPAGATVATTQFPTELAPFIKDILEKAKAQQVGAEYQAYTGPQLAQFTDAEKAAMDAMRQQTTGFPVTIFLYDLLQLVDMDSYIVEPHLL